MTPVPGSRRKLAVRITLAVVGFLLAVVGLMAAVGSMLPVAHRATREASYPVSRDSLFVLITDVPRFPSWRSGVQRVEPRPPVEGRSRWREVGGDGEILYELVETVPGRRVVIRIADPDLPFGGTWTYELADSAPGTRLRITEDGEVHNPIFRFMSRYVFGHHSAIERYLADLAAVVGA
jgi:uncharacterized protein YndB with AHSA1/START domain